MVSQVVGAVNLMPLALRLTMTCPLRARRVEIIPTIVNSRDVIIRLAELNFFMHYRSILHLKTKLLQLLLKKSCVFWIIPERICLLFSSS